MQNNLLLGNSTVAAGYVSVARDVSAIRTSAREIHFSGSSFKEGIPATVTSKRMPNIRLTENRLLATKSYPAATEIDVILHKCQTRGARGCHETLQALACPFWTSLENKRRRLAPTSRKVSYHVRIRSGRTRKYICS